MNGVCEPIHFQDFTQVEVFYLPLRVLLHQPRVQNTFFLLFTFHPHGGVKEKRSSEVCNRAWFFGNCFVFVYQIRAL